MTNKKNSRRASDWSFGWYQGPLSVFHMWRSPQYAEGVNKYFYLFVIARSCEVWPVVCTSGGASLWGDKDPPVNPDLIFQSLPRAIPTVFPFSSFKRFRVNVKHLDILNAMQSVRQLWYVSLVSVLVHPAPPGRMPLTCKGPSLLSKSVQPRNKQSLTLKSSCLVQLRLLCTCSVLSQTYTGCDRWYLPLLEQGITSLGYTLWTLSNNVTQ